MNDEQIKRMVDRFLGWKLPENFSPDGGISFTKTINENRPSWPQKNEPTGTNLFDVDQAEEMVRYMVAEVSPEPSVAGTGMMELIDGYRNGIGHRECKDLTGHPEGMPSQRKDWRAYCDRDNPRTEIVVRAVIEQIGG